jgi:putative phosphonate transport system ATP-binding protein
MNQMAPIANARPPADPSGDRPILSVSALTKRYGSTLACDSIGFDLWPGEVVAVVGESGSGKTTLLNCISGRIRPDGGTVTYNAAKPLPGWAEEGVALDLHALPEPQRRLLMRTEMGFIHQNPIDGLRMGVSGGGNIGERLMALGARHYGSIRETAGDWFARVELDPDRLDDKPDTFSGGMRQRLQIARNLVSQPRLLFMDEPTGGLDVSVQARLLDLMRGLVADFGLSVVLVTHDLAVARLLSDRMLVMTRGQVVEEGLTDQVLDDPQHPYTQLLVASVLQP